MEYFYDEQIRRITMQVIRMLSGFVTKTGRGGKNLREQFRQVPTRYGETSRMVNHILRLNSENTMLYTPIMSVYITTIAQNPERRQTPSFVSTRQVDERFFDKCNQEYTGEIGNQYSVRRPMPIPYDITYKADIWTSNIEEKVQLLEQIMMLFNPSIDIQTSDNALDWGAITYVEMLEDIQWTSKSVPLGTEEQIDVSSFTFRVAAWIQPPAEVTRRKVIHTIATNMNNVVGGSFSDGDLTFESDGELLTRIIVSPDCHNIQVDGNRITLLGPTGLTTDDQGNVYSWQDLLEQYGTACPTAQIVVKKAFGGPDGPCGTFEVDENEPNVLNWAPDPETLPDDTESPIDMVISPQENYPGDGTLPAAALMQRYLIIDDVAGLPTQAWGNLSAGIGDIIEYDGSEWQVSFDASAHDALETKPNVVTTNTFKNQQIEYVNSEWQPTVDGRYMPGMWRVKL